MKKITIGFMVLIFSFMSIASLARANDGLDEASIKQENLKMELRNDKNHSPHDIKININQNKPKLGEDRGLHLGQIMQNIHERAKVRFEISIKRIEQIQTRVQSRIDKVKSEGKDVSNAQNSLDLSKSKLAEAKSFLAQAKAIIDPHITTNPKTELSDTEKAEVKTLLEKAKNSIKESADALRKSLSSLKELSPKTGSMESTDGVAVPKFLDITDKEKKQ